MKNAIFLLVVLVVISTLILAMNGAANWLEMQPTPQNERFKVVDRYDGRCDVVQYLPTNAARYYYFLDCKK